MHVEMMRCVQEDNGFDGVKRRHPLLIWFSLNRPKGLRFSSRTSFYLSSYRYDVYCYCSGHNNVTFLTRPWFPKRSFNGKFQEVRERFFFHTMSFKSFHIQWNNFTYLFWIAIYFIYLYYYKKFEVIKIVLEILFN